MSYFFFLLVTATVFIRPGEIIPELLGLSIYEALILACFVLALPELMHYLTSGSWVSKPSTCCVFGVLAALVVAEVISFSFGEAWSAGFFFAKVVVYYLLLVSVVNTPDRLRWFMFWLVWFAGILTTVAVLQFYQVIHLPTLRPLRDVDFDVTTGQQVYIYRLQGSGVFQDPNELCLILAALVPLCLYQLTNRRLGVARVFALAPLALFLFAIGITKSRGGFLALIVGLGAMTWCRFGGKRTLKIAALGLPVLFLAFAGRQTSISATSGTGQSRVQVWSDWLYDFKHAPFFGKGLELKEERPENPDPAGQDVKLAAHNSFLHAFAQLGFAGGLMFLGAFYLALAALYRLKSDDTEITDPEMRRLHPYLFGTLAAFVMGMMSLSLCYVIPTYLMLGIAVAYVRVTPACSLAPPVCLSQKTVGRVAFAGVVFLAGMYVFVRVFINWA
jgi:putative inorganic carbon (hco3(-)) transporter